jgi:cysteine desulfurase
MLRLDREGVVCSTGSACTSDSGDSSHVLKALGLPREFAYGAVRFSLGRSTSENDISRVLKILVEAVKELRAASPSYKEKISSDRAA